MVVLSSFPPPEEGVIHKQEATQAHIQGQGFIGNGTLYIAERLGVVDQFTPGYQFTPTPKFIQKKSQLNNKLQMYIINLMIIYNVRPINLSLGQFFISGMYRRETDAISMQKTQTAWRATNGTHPDIKYVLGPISLKDLN